MKTIFEAAEIIGAKKASLARALKISPSTLYRRQVAVHSLGRLEVGGGDIHTVSFLTGMTLREEAEQMLVMNGIDPQEIRS
jgi:hypothetical protein